MSRQDWDFPLEPAPNPWKPERLVKMTVTYLVILIFLTFTLGWIVGQMTPRVDHTNQGQVPTNLEGVTAQKYADWCGGYVTMRDGHPIVTACDR